MKLLTEAQRRELTANGERSTAGEEIDPRPVVKLFTPDASATWLLSELDPSDPDRAFGLCDLGLGYPRARLREPCGARRCPRPARPSR